MTEHDLAAKHLADLNQQQDSMFAAYCSGSSDTEKLKSKTFVLVRDATAENSAINYTQQSWKQLDLISLFLHVSAQNSHLMCY